MLALAASPKPAAAPNPFTLEPSAAPSPAGLSLPSIGRTHVASPACAAHRDVVLPSLGAAMHADTRFVQAKDHLTQYASHADDAITWGVIRSKLLHDIDRDALAMLDDSLVMGRALGDPRLSQRSTDSQIVAPRDALPQIYDAHNARAWLLFKFSKTKQLAALRDLGAGNPFGSAGLSAKTSSDDAPKVPDPKALPTPDDGYPLQSGFAIADRRSVESWTSEVAREVKAVEVSAVPALVAVSHACR
ncbi:MAG: hypothetical protein NVS3B7_05520 [Candidatus Elarobacter sp.]